MDFILFGVGIITVLGMYKRPVNDSIDSSYISRRQTININGIFVLLIFCSHFRQYVTFVQYDFFSKKVLGWLYQLVVSSFLFYSGYGVTVSLLFKTEYRKKLAIRIGTTWAHFALAILLFLILNRFEGIRYDINDELLAFIGWTSIGNSNWYVFVIISLYIICWLTESLCPIKEKRTLFCYVGIGITLLLIAFLRYKGKPEWFYNTALTFWAGSLFAFYHKKVEEYVSNSKTYWIVLIVITLFFGVSFVFRWVWFLYEVHSVLFISIIVLITMRFNIGNPILSFIGKYSFEVYILQRLPMIALSKRISNIYLLFFLCLVITILLSVGFNTVTKQFDNSADRLCRKLFDENHLRK